jgi:hydrogenase nickel incorporation protein HypA/HybF
MHELSVASAVIDTATRHAEGRPVTVVAVRIGGLRQVVPDSLRFYFEVVARDTICEGARLDLTEVDPRLHCGDCGRDWEALYPAFRCPDCASAAVTVVRGDEFQVEYIEVEEPEPIGAG